jgi:hypothetical protein
MLKNSGNALNEHIAADDFERCRGTAFGGRLFWAQFHRADQSAVPGATEIPPMILAHGNGASPAMDDNIVADGIERFRATGCTRSFLSTRWLTPKTGLRSPSRLTSCLAVSHPRAVLAPGYRMIRVRDGDFGCRWNCEAFL